MKRTEQFLRQNNFKNVYVPQIYLKPTKRVLIMEYINGVHIDEVAKLK
jgi:predicted unusual protein kinase regulating ubiquinone biosynthesis (AarF/ABC1/UbiB family)